MKRAGQLLSDFFKEHFDQASLEKGRISAGLYSSWDLALRAANISTASDHSRIRELDHKVLVVEAEHPGWVQLLQTKQSQLLKHVQGKYPELDIQGISFCLSRELISSAPTAPENNPTRTETDSITPDTKEVNEALYEPIKEFRQVIQKRKKT